MTATNMEKRPLGRTGLQVTPVCFGTSGLGDMPDTYGYSVGEDRAESTLRAIFESRVNFIDAARIYGLGRSEARIGAVLRERGLPPGLIVSTKLDRDPQTHLFDAAQARRSLEQSFKALGLQKIDVLHLHDPEHASSFETATAKDGALGELFRIKEEGLATAVGLAAGPSDMMLKLLPDWDFDVLITHNRFTLANRSAEALLALAAQRGVAVMNAAPYAGGVLAKGAAGYKRYVYQQADEATLAPIRAIEEVCARHGVAPGAAALQFSLREKRIASTVCGVSKPERVKETLDWASAAIPQACWEELMALPYAKDDPEATRQHSVG